MDPIRPEYHRARARWESGRIIADSTGFQRSSRIASIAETNCLLEIPKATGTLAAGTVVKALLLGGLRPEPEGFPVPKIPMPTVEVQAPTTSGPKVGLLLLDTAEGNEVKVMLKVSLADVLREERKPKEVKAITELLELWCQEKEGLDLVLVIGDLNFGDHEILEALQSLVHRHAENLADLLLHEGLRQSPLAMLRPTVAGYRYSTLVVTLSSSTSAAVGSICKVMTSASGV